MESGIIVVYGRPSDDALDSFHQYKKTSAGWSKLGELKGLCEHEDSIALLPLTVNGKEVLAVGCGECQVIKLLDIQNGEVTVAFQKQNFCALVLCKGGGDTLYVMHEKGDAVMASELSTNQIPFTLTKKIIPSGMTIASRMLYIPHPDNVLVFSTHFGLIKAVSAETGEKIWEVEGTVDDEECCPSGLIRVATCQGKVREKQNFLQVRELSGNFEKMSGNFDHLTNVREMSGNFVMTIKFF